MLCNSIRETILILSLAQKLLKVLLFGLIRFLSNNKQQTERQTQRERETESVKERERDKHRECEQQNVSKTFLN